MNRSISELELDRRLVIKVAQNMAGDEPLRVRGFRELDELARLERAARDGLHAAALREASPSQAMAIGALHARAEALAEVRVQVSACGSLSERSAELSRLEEGARCDLACAVADGNGLQEFSTRVRAEAFADARAALDGVERDQSWAEGK